MATPSLAMIPSAYADSKVYSVLPNNGDGDFTFDRASTATRVGQNGLIETVLTDIPRLNYDISNGVVQSCPSLLLEPASTNLVPYSQTFTGWSLTNAVETPNALISPDGNLNASKIVTSATGLDVKYTNIPVAANTVYTYSFYCNYVGGLGLQGRFYDNTNGANIEYYDYMNQIEEGKWKRVTRTFTTPSGCSNIQIWYLAASSTFPVTAYYWGAQLEALSYATSYIPTLSGAIQTRAVETCNDAGNASTFNSTEGTFFIKVNYINTTESFRISISDNTSNNKIILATLNNKYYYEVRAVDASISASILSNIPQTTNEVLLAGTWKQNEFKFFVNGTKIGEDTLGNSPNGLDTVRFNNFSTNQPFYGRARDIRVYNEALSDAQLTVLTTL